MQANLERLEGKGPVAADFVAVVSSLPQSETAAIAAFEETETGSTHANHRSLSSPRPTPEGSARDNPIAGP